MSSILRFMDERVERIKRSLGSTEGKTFGPFHIERTVLASFARRLPIFWLKLWLVGSKLVEAPQLSGAEVHRLPDHTVNED